MTYRPSPLSTLEETVRHFAIRPIDARDWPCPWASYASFHRGSNGMCSWPMRWPLEAAKKWVDDANAKEAGVWAVFSVTPRGQKQAQVYPVA